METVAVPVEIVDTVLHVFKWIATAIIAATAVLVVAMLASARDSAQQKQLTRDSIIKNERANILHGIETGLSLSEQRYEALLDHVRKYVFDNYNILPNQLSEWQVSSKRNEADEPVGSSSDSGSPSNPSSTGTDSSETGPGSGSTN